MIQDLIQIGYTLKVHGVHGEFKVHVEEEYLPDFMKLKMVYITTGEDAIPYFVDHIRGGNILLLKVEGVSTPEKAKQLTSRELFARTKDLSYLPPVINVGDDEAEYAYLEGFTVTDEVLGALGTIESVEIYPAQEIALVNYQGREVIFPLHPQFFVAIDKEKRVLRVNLPEGMLEL